MGRLASGGGERDNAAHARVRYGDGAGRIHSDERFVIQPVPVPAIHRPFGRGSINQPGFIRGEDLDTLVPGIAHVGVPQQVNVDVDRFVKLTKLGARGTELAQVRPIAVEYDNALVARIGHEDMP